MALPLPVEVQPLQQPFEFALLAEAQLLFDLAGIEPLPPIEEVIQVDFYTSGQVTNEYSFYATGEPIDEEVLENMTGVGNPEGACPRPENFFGGVVPHPSVGFFPVVGGAKHPCGTPTLVVEPALTSLFEWIDVSSFYWFESPYPILDEIEPYVPPDPIVPDPFFEPAWRPSFMFDFFLGRYRSVGCDPVDLEVLAPAAVVVEGFEPEVAATLNVVARPLVRPLVVEGVAPSVVVTESVWVAPAQAGVVVEGFAPSVVATANVSVVPATASIGVVGLAPAVDDGGAGVVPCNAVYFDGEPVLFDGEYVVFGTLTADSTGISADSTCLTADHA